MITEIKSFSPVQLGIEFARAGADITQTFTFWAHEDALPKGCKFSVGYITQH